MAKLTYSDILQENIQRHNSGMGGVLSRNIDSNKKCKERLTFLPTYDIVNHDTDVIHAHGGAFCYQLKTYSPPIKTKIE